jgi:HlyD family secretion protein
VPEKHEEIELRSDEVQEILTRVPSWMIRWGITLIFGLIIGCLLMSWLIKYPDVISGQVVLTTELPPAKLVSKTPGQIDQILVNEYDFVEEGQVIAKIRNPLSTEAFDYLVQLEEIVSEALDNELIQIPEIAEANYAFGSAQNDYNTLVDALTQYEINILQNQFESRKNILRKQVGNYRELSLISDRQVELSEENYALAEDRFKRNETLYNEGAISKVEFYDQKERLSQKSNELENVRKTAIQNRITLTDYEKQLMDLELEELKLKEELMSRIITSLNNIRNELNNWQETYLLIAPMSGQVNFLQPLSEAMYVEAGKPLVAIIPDQENTYIGYIELDKQGYGKVEKGQEVKMSFGNFPDAEFGQLPGVVKEVSSIPNENLYTVKVELKQGLLTSYNKKIDYSPEMSGQASIITEDLRLLERIFNQFRKLFDN